MIILGKSAMVFPTPQIDGFENEAGMIYKKGQFLVSTFNFTEIQSIQTIYWHPDSMMKFYFFKASRVS